MKKKLAFLLAIVMVLSLMFVGCGSGNDSDTQTTTKPLTTEEAVVGKWTADVDFTEPFVASMGDMGDMGEYFTFKDFDLKFIVELNADKTYTLSLDEAVTKASMDKIVDQMMAGMEDYMNDMLKDSGSDMTFEDVLESQGMTTDDYKKSLKDEMDISAFDMSSKGKYTVDGDNIALKEDGADESTTFTYADGSLKFVDFAGSASGATAEMMKKALKEVTFKKN